MTNDTNRLFRSESGVLHVSDTEGILRLVGAWLPRNDYHQTLSNAAVASERDFGGSPLTIKSTAPQPSTPGVFRRNETDSRHRQGVCGDKRLTALTGQGNRVLLTA